MPWTQSDAKRFSKKASGSSGGSKQWSDVANSVLSKIGDEGSAIKQANGVIARRVRKTGPSKMGGTKGI